MLDPVAWLWSFADHDGPVFDEASLYLILGSSYERLLAANFVVRTASAEYVTCPSCVDGHSEEVVALDWPDGTIRYFVSCPEYRRVEVPPELLCRWTVDWNALVRAVAAALALGGECVPLFEGRLWRLGRTKWQGAYRDVLFARGLNWADGRDVIAHAARSTRPIVFVGDRVPPTELWSRRVPPIVALSQVTQCCEHGLSVDREAVFAAILDAGTEPTGPETKPIAAPSLALMIRRQVKAEGKSQLTDDILIAAYQQEGSVRKAAELLSERTGKVVTKDKVQSTLRRCGGAKTVLRERDGN